MKENLMKKGRRRNEREGVPLREHYDKDTGCELASSCLNCPFEICRYDLHGGQRLKTLLDNKLSVFSLEIKEMVAG